MFDCLHQLNFFINFLMRQHEDQVCDLGNVTSNDIRW